MKKFVVTVITLLTMSSIAFAYSPTDQDRELRTQAKERINTLYPDNITKLLSAYKKIDRLKPIIEITYGERGLRFLEEIQEILVEKLFESTQVCIQSYTQVGDTVEVMYLVYGPTGELLRETVIPLAFNPGKEQVRKSLDESVLGLQQHDATAQIIKTIKVIPSEEGTRTKIVPLDELLTQKDPVIGMTYVFGSTSVPGAVIGTITAMDETTATFDFENSPIGEQIVLHVTLEQLRKGCSMSTPDTSETTLLQRNY